MTPTSYVHEWNRRDGYMTNPRTTLVDLQERPHSYGPGGLHPVVLGDVFKDGRYEVVHKLGFGKSATVWLAEDLNQTAWVALKICRADITDPRELAMLYALQQSSVAEYVAELYDHFIHTGPNGSHICIVTNVIGPSLENRVFKRGQDRKDLAMEEQLQLTAQLLQTVMDLHNAGFAHGDLSPGDVIFRVGKLQSLNRQQLFEFVGEPQVADLLREDGLPLGPHLPRQMTDSMDWANWDCKVGDKLCLVDWGEGFRHDAPLNRRLSQTLHITAPETIFTDNFDHRVDLWAAGCCIYVILFRHNPFEDWGSCSILQQMLGLVESLPPEWEARWEQIQRDYKYKGDDWPEDEKLLRRFLSIVPEPELTPLLPIMQRLMRFKPSDRISARQALSILFGAPASPPPAAPPANGGEDDMDMMDV
ncbi:hypothetical protein NLG97_g9902 [Lecanicillium saksenae]|uniref:Uncharacterized protein n=1 Tax=Lecanicillium saksenae TaxID=468837 RepID=A0ACC1QHP9_9HYPO|nr:hypothetical protein NLG97_g9902 [Lecanicillium saksenae]